MTKSSPLVRLALCVLLSGSFAAPSAIAADAEPQLARLPLEKTLKGPIHGIITQGVDGDTVKVEVQTWLNQSLNTTVRIDGIDTPEIKGRCDEERANAERAKVFVASLTPVGSTVTLHQVRSGKYANRVVADVYAANGQSVAQAVLDAQLGRPYDGGRREPWCP
jgi:endonuclease YncB( thermonuclease family)